MKTVCQFLYMPETEARYKVKQFDKTINRYRETLKAILINKNTFPAQVAPIVP